MPRVRVTNVGRRPRGFYAAGGRFVSLPVGGTTEPVSINEGTERALFNSGDVEFQYLDDGEDDRATLLAKAGTMSAAEFRDAAGALLGREFSTKKAAMEALEHGGDGGGA